MLDRRHLKPAIEITTTSVECPVLGCSERVERQRRTFNRESRFRCPVHPIFISPTTFEYADECDNLLWKGPEDTALLDRIKTVKRESRLARDNSEDALTWNVFRYLETAQQLPRLISWIAGEDHQEADLIYWSYSQRTNGIWPLLSQAHEEFHESQRCSSEPDLIAMSEKGLFFIEAKFTAANDTASRRRDHGAPYLTGGGGWWKQVFTSDFEAVAVTARKYELARLWLLGSWLATQVGREFHLVNIVLARRETDIEQRFTSYLFTTAQRQFRRVTWEGIGALVVDKAPSSAAKSSLVAYLQGKTMGYDRCGRMRRAFPPASGYGWA